MSSRSLLSLGAIFLYSFFLGGCQTLELSALAPSSAEVHPPYQVVWAKNFDPSYDTGNLPISSLAPAIEGQTIYVGTQQGSVLALDLVSGRELWKVQESEAITSPVTVAHQMVFYGDALGRFSARTLKGELVYTIDLGHTIQSPAVFDSRGDRLLVHLRNHKLICLDARTGKVLWNYQRSVADNATIEGVSTPLNWKDKIIVGHADGALTQLSWEEGAVLWEQSLGRGSKFIDVDMTPVIFNEALYVASHLGELHKLDPATGAVIQRFAWKVLKRPLVWQQWLFVGTQNGEILKLDAQGTLLQERSFPDLGMIFTLDQWQDRLMVSTLKGRILLLNPADLSSHGHFDFGHTYSVLFSRPVIQENYAAIYSARNRLYLLKRDDGK